MKIKADFITNSSSTSFILQFNLALKELKLKEDIDLYEIATRVKENFCGEFSVVKKYDDYNVSIKSENESGNKEDLLNLELIKIPTYEENNCINSLFCDISLTSEVLFTNPGSSNLNHLIEIFKAIFKDITGNLELIFYQHPIEIGGSGWYGDPMGEYSNLYDLYKNEVQTGKIVRIDNEWKLKKNKIRK